jgi:hypothetical protein
MQSRGSPTPETASLALCNHVDVAFGDSYHSFTLDKLPAQVGWEGAPMANPEQQSMARKVRIAAIGTIVLASILLVALGAGYYAARQVRPFYEQALQIEPAALEQGSRELESRATALYSDVKQVGTWRAVFTAEQINGWLATQLAADLGKELPANLRDPRVAIGHDVFTLGFRTSSGGVETVVSVDASASITQDGAVAIRLIAVRAGALPLPVFQLADQLADACRKMKLPVRWTQHEGRPVALVEIRAKHPVFVDAIQLDEGRLYVAGHTDNHRQDPTASTSGTLPAAGGSIDALGNYELRLTPTDQKAALEIARRQDTKE